MASSVPLPSVPPLKRALDDLAKEQDRRARIFARLGKRHDKPEYRAWAEHERRLADAARGLAAGLEY